MSVEEAMNEFARGVLEAMAVETLAREFKKRNWKLSESEQETIHELLAQGDVVVVMAGSSVQEVRAAGQKMASRITFECDGKQDDGLTREMDEAIHRGFRS